MQRILIIGSVGTGLKTLVKAIKKIGYNDSNICISATETTVPEGITSEPTVFNDQTYVEDLIVKNHNILIDDLIDDYYFPVPKKEKYFIQNEIAKNLPTIKKHRIQTRNTLPQRIRVNEKPKL